MAKLLSSKYILSIDDDEDFNRILAHTVKKMGHEIITTTTPDEFTTQLKKLRPTLCLIDLNLDVALGAGFHLLQAIRTTQGYDLPLLILSKRKNQEDIAKALELGANDFVPKPLDDAFLEQKIKQYLNPSTEIKSLPFFVVSEKDQDSTIHFNLEVESLNEEGLTLKGGYFLGKNSHINISGAMVEKIFSIQKVKLTVQKSWVNDDTHQFHSFCEFDFEDEEVMPKVRNFILNHITSA
jgi:DNA-binding response OmpR family regulator